VVGITKKSDPGDMGRCLLEQLQALGGDFVRQASNAGGIPSRFRKTRRKADLNWIGAGRIDDRSGAVES
jgi:hypothetical protein